MRKQARNLFKMIQTNNHKIRKLFRNLNIPRLTKKRGEKLGVPDYGIALEDEDIPDYGLDDFFDEGLDLIMKSK